MPAAKKPAKVIDGVHAGAAPAAPTSRPLITNRPFMAMDPMLNPNKEANDTVEQSSNAAPKKSTTTRTVDRTAKDIMPSTDPVETTETVDEVAETDENPAETKETVPAAPADVPSVHETDEHKPALVPSSPEKPLKTIPSKAPDEDEAETDADLKADVPNTEEDAAAAQKLEIERHIAAGTYFVTINHRRHHRRTVLLVVVLMLIAAGVALDILLDMGVLKLPSLPHTNFF
jgi:hypothetical protein